MQSEIHLPIVLDAVRQIGDTFLKDYKKSPVPQHRADLLQKMYEVEEQCLSFLKEKLEPYFPSTPWAGNEFDFEEQKKPLNYPEYWFCDTMDGIIQYLQQVSGWTINLALIREGRTQLSVIYDPLSQEMFWAIEGGGAFLNGERIKPSAKTELKDMLAVFEYTHHDTNENGIYQKIGTSVSQLLEHVGVVRNYGPHGLQLAYVGAGRIDIFHQEDLDTYNWLAGILIAKEAGAEILTTDGRPWSWGEDSLLVAGKQASKLLLETTQKHSSTNSASIQ